MDRIRVLHCIHSLSGGGAERQLKILADESAKQAMDAGIFCVRDLGRDDLQDASVRVYTSKSQKRYNFSLVGSLNSAIDDFKPAVLHAWLPASMTIPAMALAALRSIPCVFSYRNVMSFRRFLAFPEYMASMLFATRVVSNNCIRSSNLAYRLMYHVKNGVRINNAVRIDSRWLKATPERSDDAWNVLFVGRLTRAKNWPCLLRAIALLQSHREVSLTICGDGEQREQMRMMIADLGLGGIVKYLGYQRNIYQLMQASDLLVLPSLWEGMPNVLLEALGIGLPCLISDIPAHRDIIGTTKAALMFDPADPQELAMQITLVRNNVALARQLAQEGKKVVQDYTPERMARAHYEFYARMN